MTARLANPAAAKDPRKTWYSLQQWKNRRTHQLRIEPLCRLCMEQNRLTPATVADHIEPHLGDYNNLCSESCDPYARLVMMRCKVSFTRIIARRSASMATRSTVVTRSIKHDSSALSYPGGYAAVDCLPNSLILLVRLVDVGGILRIYLPPLTLALVPILSLTRRVSSRTGLVRVDLLATAAQRVYLLRTGHRRRDPHPCRASQP
jgi:hypothetical protein